jgi:hypothetical protein
MGAGRSRMVPRGWAVVESAGLFGVPRLTEESMRSMATVLEELLNEQGTAVEEVMARHFTPAYRQRTGGVWADWPEIARNLTHIRTMIRSVKIELLDELVVGSAYADRHVLTLELSDGTRQVRESYLFGSLAPDGRFQTIEEVTLVDPAHSPVAG